MVVPASVAGSGHMDDALAKQRPSAVSQQFAPVGFSGHMRPQSLLVEQLTLEHAMGASTPVSRGASTPVSTGASTVGTSVRTKGTSGSARPVSMSLPLPLAQPATTDPASRDPASTTRPP